MDGKSCRRHRTAYAEGGDAFKNQILEAISSDWLKEGVGGKGEVYEL